MRKIEIKNSKNILKNKKFLHMQQILKGPKTYQIKTQSLNLPYKARKQLRISKYFQAIREPIQINHYIKNKKQQTKYKNKQYALPYQMSQTFIKYMLFYRIATYLTVLSIVLSLISVYSQIYSNVLILANNGITLSILVAICIKLYLYIEHLISKKQDMNAISILHIIIQFILVLPHPTIWTIDYNYILHLLLLPRIFIIIKFSIQSSIYCNMRAERIININGLNASQHFLFAVKSLVQSLNFLEILAIQFLSVFFFTHCFYLVSLAQEYRYQLIDCFEIVMSSMPTIGFGQYEVPHFGQKIILVLAVINGAVFNSFVTLSMLSHLEMAQSQQSSYWLFKKIQTRQLIESISKKYIQKSFSKIRQKKGADYQQKQHINFSFKNQYRLRKSLYNSISYTDINNLFAYYHDRLVQYKISQIQTSNMIIVLLRSLKRYNMQLEIKNQ